MDGLILRCALVLALAAGPAIGAQETDWKATWEELERVGAAPDSGDGPAARARLALLATREGRDPRGRLLAVWLERIAGRAAELELSPEEVERLSPSEAWLAARVLADRPALDRALIRAMAQPAGAARDQSFQAAFDRFVALSAVFEQQRALSVARAMHANAGAWWSAANLSTALRRAGEFEEAYELLSAQLARAQTRAEAAAIRQDRSLVDVGAGWEARARDDLGAALAHGSSDAAVVLGRLALSTGRFERARAVFRSVLREDPPQSWALRGWGLSMLPRKRERL